MPRFVLPLLAALLLALQFFGPTVPTVSAHSSHAAAPHSGAPPTEGVDVHVDEVPPCSDGNEPEEATGWLRCPRHRTVTEPSPCVVRAYDVTAAPPPINHAVLRVTSRGPTSHSRTSLQVFRC